MHAIIDSKLYHDAYHYQVFNNILWLPPFSDVDLIIDWFILRLFSPEMSINGLIILKYKPGIGDQTVDTKSISVPLKYCHQFSVSADGDQETVYVVK